MELGGHTGDTISAEVTASSESTREDATALADEAAEAVYAADLEVAALRAAKMAQYSREDDEDEEHDRCSKGAAHLNRWQHLYAL